MITAVIVAALLGWVLVCAILQVLATLFLDRVLARTVREGRIQEGRCLNCGYDLRATPERCPECGMVPEKKEPVPS